MTMSSTLNNPNNHKTIQNELFSKRQSKSTSSSSSSPNNKSKPSTTKTKQLQEQEAKSIASSLHRTKHMMKNELERLNTVSQTIDLDSKTIEKTKAEHLHMKDNVAGAKQQMNKMKRLENEERFIFWLSVLFFYSVVAYVVWCRIRIPFLLW